jgi:hypothetical protein
VKLQIVHCFDPSPFILHHCVHTRCDVGEQDHSEEHDVDLSVHICLAELKIPRDDDKENNGANVSAERDHKVKLIVF